MNNTVSSDIPHSAPRIPSSRRVVAYTRRSHKDQENSLNVQRESLVHYAGWKALAFDPAADIFVETESAARVPFSERAEAMRMLDHMAANGIAEILFLKLDRGFRNTEDCLAQLRAFEAAGITAHFLDIDVDMGTSSGKFVITLLAAVAQFEVERRAERQAETLAHLRKTNRVVGEIGYGWKKDDTGGLVPDTGEQAILVLIIEAYRDGLRAGAIATLLNESGVAAKKGGRWGKSSVRALLQSARLADGTTVATLLGGDAA